jgi:hypothetical protein
MDRGLLPTEAPCKLLLFCGGLSCEIHPVMDCRDLAIVGAIRKE